MGDLYEVAGVYAEFIYLFVLAILLLLSCPLWLPFYAVRRYRKRFTGEER
jgi:hypothetical protein